MNNNQYQQSKVPFFLEVEYYNDYNTETENKIMRSIMFGDEILPGLRINKMFANCVDKNDLIADEIANDLKHLQEEFEKFKNKYISFSDNKSNIKSEMINNNKEISKDNTKPKSNNIKDRYQAYDDIDNFPK